MPGDLADLAGAAIEVADAVGEIVDVGRKRNRWKGCLILLVLIAAIALLFAFLAD